MPSEWQGLEPTRTRIRTFTVNHKKERNWMVVGESRWEEKIVSSLNDAKISRRINPEFRTQHGEHHGTSLPKTQMPGQEADVLTANSKKSISLESGRAVFQTSHKGPRFRTTFLPKKPVGPVPTKTAGRGIWPKDSKAPGSLCDPKSQSTPAVRILCLWQHWDFQGNQGQQSRELWPRKEED